MTSAGAQQTDNDPLQALIDRLKPRGPVSLRNDTVYVPYALSGAGDVVAAERCYLTEQLYLKLLELARAQSEQPVKCSSNCLRCSSLSSSSR